MKTIGISIYPDFDNKEKIKQQLDYAKTLGYRIVFTSMQLGDLGFENTEVGLNDDFYFLFEYCHKIGMEIHADINDRMLFHLGAQIDNLKPISDLHIKVLRLDGGFTDHEVAVMTHNAYGIKIEENASMLQFPRRRIETIVEEGCINNYCACHNFFPLNETGLSYQDALNSARLFKSYGIQVGIFIGSLYSSCELNAIGRGIITIEDHRYKPSHIQAMELFAHEEYDYVIFGDTHPSLDELKKVSEVAKNDTLEVIKSKYSVERVEEELDHIYCIELPVWLNTNIDEKLKKQLTSMVFVARSDQPKDLIRATQSRGISYVEVDNPIQRFPLSITLNNCLSNRYMGELQIVLEELPSVDYVNVIGQVKPYARQLLEEIKYGRVAFVLKEE
mgnify:CR=1 FL=1